MFSYVFKWFGETSSLKYPSNSLKISQNSHKLQINSPNLSTPHNRSISLMGSKQNATINNHTFNISLPLIQTTIIQNENYTEPLIATKTNYNGIHTLHLLFLIFPTETFK